MQRTTQPGWWLLGLVVPLLLLAAGGADLAEETDDGINVYFRDTELGALAKQDAAKFPGTDAGESQLIDRSFPDAPPSIPHTVEDMYPITPGDNECLECHHPDNAVEGTDIPLPETHFRQPVMAKGGKNDAMVWVVKSYKQAKDVVGSRYNCSMCHTPQADNVRTIKSTFKRVKGGPTQ
jgi:nitrate reductase cytochrome c-type subunit